MSALLQSLQQQRNQPRMEELALSTSISFFDIEGLDERQLLPFTEGMAREAFDRQSAAGFMVEKQSSRTIEGRYIRKLSLVNSGVDPFGDPYEVTTVEFVEQRFVIGVNRPQMILLNSSTSAKALTGRLSEFSNFSIAIAPVELAPDAIFQEFDRRFENVRVYAAVVRDIKLAPTALVQLRFHASDDVRTHVRRFLGKRKIEFESLKIEFAYSGANRRAEICSSGHIQVYGEYDPTLRDMAIETVSVLLRKSMP